MWIALLGLVGVFCRYGLDQWAVRLAWPAHLMTLVVNGVGSFAAATLYVAAREKGLLSPELGTGALVGFCGGFTTFSAYALQAVGLFEKGQMLTASLYLFGSPVIGAVAASLGLALARR